MSDDVMVRAGAADRWRRLAGRQAAQSRRLREALDADLTADEPELETGPPAVDHDDPFLAYVLSAVDGHTTVLDAGAGTGRLALPLAAHVRHVVAADPDDEALAELARGAGVLGIGNVTTVAAPVESPDVPRCDVAMSAFVLDTLVDVEPFLRRLDELARRRVLVCTTAQSTFAPYHPLWAQFHDDPRELGPSHLDAAAIVREFGGEPVVHTILRDGPGPGAGPDHRSIAEAVGSYRALLFLPDEPAVTEKLARILPDWLVRDRHGFRDPVPALPFAVIDWLPREARDDVR